MESVAVIDLLSSMPDIGTFVTHFFFFQLCLKTLECILKEFDQDLSPVKKEFDISQPDSLFFA